MKKPTDILGLVNLLKQLSTDHYAIADFRHDVELNFDDVENNYPLLFLEAEKQIIGNRNDNSNTYSIAIQLCDIPLDSNYYTQTEAKLQYITNDIIHALTNMGVNMSDTNSLPFGDAQNDLVNVFRTEFTIVLGKSNTPMGNPFKSN